MTETVFTSFDEHIFKPARNRRDRIIHITVDVTGSPRLLPVTTKVVI
jgi:hypothetical protein